MPYPRSKPGSRVKNVFGFEFIMIYTAQEWTSRTLAVHEWVDSRFLVLPGSESTITEITAYIYFGQFEARREF